MSKPLTSSDARRLARMAQVGAVGLGVSAAALWALDVPGLSAVPVAVPASAVDADPAATTTGPGTTEPTLAFTGDVARGVAERFDQAVKKAEKPATTTKPDPPPLVPTEPTPEPSDWRFIGVIREPTRLLAVVAIEGRGQVIVPEGRRVEKTEVLRVTDQAITIREGEVEREIQREARSTKSGVGWMSMPANQAPVVTGPASGMPQGIPAGGAGGQVANFTPEALERMRARGLDPERVRQFRDLARERRNARLRGDPSIIPPTSRGLTQSGAASGAAGTRGITEDTARPRRFEEAGEDRP